jgi:uncharacterized protein DUF4166
VSSASLFPSRLGADFGHLKPQLRWVHGGESRDLHGSVTVERGTSLIAKVLGRLTSLPPPLDDATIQVRIEVEDQKERWIRTFAGQHRMTSVLFKHGDCLVEQLGPASFTFRLISRDAGIDWRLEHVSLAGIPLPVSWFSISARIDLQGDRYHFLIDSAVRGVGRIVRYEGLLDAKP